MSMQNLPSMFGSAYWETVTPDYRRYCFANIPSAVLYLLGAEKNTPLRYDLEFACVEPAPHKVVLFLLDGFGYLQWKRYANHFEALQRFNNSFVTSLNAVFPSTTAAALTTIHSGLTPQEHGLPEWWVYFREIDKLIKTLPFTPMGEKGTDRLREAGVDPKILFNGRTIYEKLADVGVPSYMISPLEYEKSAYSSLVHRGSISLPYTGVREMFQVLTAHLKSTTGPSYTYVYWPDIDSISHEFGPHSPEYVKTVQQFCAAFEEEFFAKLPEEATRDLVLLLTADHGQILVDPNETIMLNQFPEVVDNLRIGADGKKILPWGGARDVFLAVAPDKCDAVFDFLTRELGERAVVLRSADALAAGLFGKGTVHPEFPSRIGDILIIPQGNKTVWFERVPGKKFKDLGIHGGLHEEEMLVPFVVTRGDELWRARV